MSDRRYTIDHSPNSKHSLDSAESSVSWKKRVSTACLACKKSKRKCSGTPPCDNCCTFHRVCIFDESLDQRRRVAAKRTANELVYHRNLMQDLFKLVRIANEPQARDLLDIIRRNAPPEEIRTHINKTLSTLNPNDELSKKAVEKFEDMRDLISVEDSSPTFRRKVMDIHYLCDVAPVNVPAKPWTNVTDDCDLVSHLVSLYFVWDYPFNSFVEKDVFLREMQSADLDSQFCTPLLVNALLSNACYFSEFSEAYVVPGDISSKGCDFLAEAERLREEESSEPSLASLQASLLMYERYALSRSDDLGYTMLHVAIRMGEALGLVGNKGPRMTTDLSPDMDASWRRTAWGLFNVDTYVIGPELA
ncbi:hypothetical protein N7495_007297 [Penicillium taxi]|uniref:uncharacterized protein n=1 Tax=Penicillium taxi TaxID=168475 RepID=UPI002544D9F7|nr:uncharacterized protein N7495_007297 [Penicillium taxi]KAJ5895606.1 hypothetical protein N7495_007297 [Penicillium taxi]